MRQNIEKIRINLKKQSQFAGGADWRNNSNSNDLWRF